MLRKPAPFAGAQRGYEEDLRTVRGDGAQLEFRWETDQSGPPVSWTMQVRPPRLHRFVRAVRPRPAA